MSTIALTPMVEAPADLTPDPQKTVAYIITAVANCGPSKTNSKDGGSRDEDAGADARTSMSPVARRRKVGF